MTWNVWWRFGVWRERLDAIWAVIDDVQPDILTLQEIWDDGSTNLARLLADRLEAHVVWSLASNLERWRGRVVEPGVAVGDAIISRSPIVRHETLTLPSGDAHDEGRSALWALLDVDGVMVPVLTAQLNSSPSQSDVRCLQVRTLAKVVEAHGVRAFPSLLTGDLNAEPDSDEIRLLCGHKTRGAVPGLVFVDAWRYAPPEDLGLTWDRTNPYVARTGEPSARIDYVMTTAPGRDLIGRILSVRLAGNAPIAGVWPSDHAAVVVDLARVATLSR
jgi:endonuclease/exonuclease/phosphatase family metal-dependent hydrolase